MADALALGGDEGRDKLRKVTGRWTTRYPEGISPYLSKGLTQGTETS